MKYDSSSRLLPSPSAAFMKAADFSTIAKIYGGLPFLGAIPGSPAERELRRGDVVISVNGMPTPDFDAFIQARALRTGSAT
ncbi:MAG: PDZ domain-containing protein, partial [Polyangiaceae bacterium]